jgi:outer membrane protein OmpA-like peptidoglycan-associated protein
MLNPKKTPTYTWTSDAGPVSGTSTTASVATGTLSAGTFTVKGHVMEGPKPGEMADCSAQFAVKAFEPPTVSCSASPTSVNPGDSATITASGQSPQSRPLTYSYSSTAGSVSGTAASATLSTGGAAPGRITVTCNVVDDKGQTASATTSVTVIAPPPPPVVHKPTTSPLGSVSFGHDARRPTRVDNEAKAALDDIALSLQRAPDAKLAIVGTEDSAERAANAKKKKPADFGAERAVNTKEYLVTEKGIDPSRIMVYTGSADAQSVTTTLVPTGADLDTTGDTPIDESAVKAVPRDPVKKK